MNQYIACLEGFKQLFALQAKSDIESLQTYLAIELDPNDILHMENCQAETYFILFVERGLVNTHLNRVIETQFQDAASIFFDAKKRLMISDTQST